MNPDFEKARQYVFDRLDNELASHFLYHNSAHTRHDVLPAPIRLAGLAGLNSESLLLLQTAALYHDLGYVERISGHEAVSVRIATETLPGFGYSADQIKRIGDIIMATKLPQSPKDFLGELLADADLDVLGRDDFLEKSRLLRLELETQEIYHTEAEWYGGQLSFLESHAYFTPAARSLRLEQKRKNIQALKNLLEKC